MEKRRLTVSQWVDPKTHISFTTRRVERPVTLHFHDFYELEIVLSGTGRQNLNGSEYALTPGTVYFLTPIDFHQVTPEDGLTVQNLIFEESLISPGIQLALMKRRGDLIFTDPEKAEYLAGLTARLENQQEDGFAPVARRALVELLLIELLRQEAQGPSPSLSDPMQAALSYLFCHFREEISLQTLAALCNYTPSYFSALFRKTCGMGYLEFLERLRVNYARQLLASSTDSITQVGEKCGFSSQASFFRVFRRETGVSPGEYRRRISAP